MTLPPRPCSWRAAAGRGLALVGMLLLSAGPLRGAPGGALRWSRLRALRGVRRAFAHPFDPDVAWCATAAGLLATADGGQTWAPVESAAAEAVGEVTCLAVSPRDPGTICLGSDTRGLLLSTDGGKAWRPLGGRAEACAARHVEWVDFCPADPTRRTLLATHGLAGPGLSVSRDLGATWEVFGRDRFLKRFVKQTETIVAVGSMAVTEGKVWGIHRSGTDGQRWEETVRDLRPTAPAATSASRWQFFVATLDGAILRSGNDGKSWSELVRSDGSAWASLFFVNGPGARDEVLAAYDPHRQGLRLSRDRFAGGPGEPASRGLYVGPYVKSGASCVANANGTAFYVAMNNALWVGRREPPAAGPAVAQARCVPCSVDVSSTVMTAAKDDLHARIAAIASDEPAETHLGPIAAAARTVAESEARLGFTVRARVQVPAGARGVKSVTVDASALGAGAAVTLHDDGRHDDAKPADGTYAAAIRFSPDVFGRQGFRERLLLTVTATDAGGRRATWPAVVNIPRGPAAVSLMRGGYDCEWTEGPAAIRWVRVKSGRSSSEAIRFEPAGGGPWRAAWIMPDDGVNSAGLGWLAFRIKGEPSQELSVHLVDHHRIGREGFFDEPHFSRPVPLIGGGYLRAVTPAYQEVRIPVSKLLSKGTFFLRWHTAGIGLSGGAAARAGTYDVDQVRLEP